MLLLLQPLPLISLLLLLLLQLSLLLLPGRVLDVLSASALLICLKQLLLLVLSLCFCDKLLLLLLLSFCLCDKLLALCFCEKLLLLLLFRQKTKRVTLLLDLEVESHHLLPRFLGLCRYFFGLRVGRRRRLRSLLRRSHDVLIWHLHV